MLGGISKASADSPEQEIIKQEIKTEEEKPQEIQTEEKPANERLEELLEKSGK